jgi:hypothetical protein
MIKILNAKTGRLISSHKTMAAAARAVGVKPETLRMHFHRYKDEYSYGVYEGSKAAGNVKYIILRSAK